MSKFSVGQSVLVGEAFKERKKSVHGVSFPSHLTATVVGDDGECLGPVIRLNCEGMETPRDALGVWARTDGWGANDGELTRLPLHRFSVNDKVTLTEAGARYIATYDQERKNGDVGVVIAIDQRAVVEFDGGRFWSFELDGHLDPYVEPPAPERPSFDNDEIIAYITSRFEKGFETYGQGVKVDDPYDWPTMTLEELADACIYLTAQVLRLKRQEAKGA